MKTLLLHSNEVGIAVRCHTDKETAYKEMTFMVLSHLYFLTEEKLYSIFTSQSKEVIAGDWENLSYKLSADTCTIRLKELNLFLHWQIYHLEESGSNKIQATELIDDICE